MSDEEDERLALKDLVVVFSGDERQRHVGAVYNPFGMTAWFNTAGMAVVFASKRYLVTGQLVVRALRTRGWFNAEERQDMYQFPADVPSTAGFLKDCLRLLFVGVPFEALDTGLLLRPRERHEEFYLTRRT